MTTPRRELLRFEHVAVGYGRRRVLEDVNLTLHAGDYLAIVGSNGAGKSTLLRALLGILPPQSGRIWRERIHYGYVPQLQTVDEIFPLTVFEVVLMGCYGRLGPLRRPSTADRNRAATTLDETGIAHLGDRLYRELSGGQKQRTLIARALMSEPDVLVLDEHTNDLDLVAEKAVMALIDQLHAEHHIAVVMVSHSLNTVANHARTIGILRDGRCQVAPADEVMQTKYLQDLYGVPLQVTEMNGRIVVVY